MWQDKGGTGLWVERVNEQTGETSIKEHTPSVVATRCKHCVYPDDIGNKRELECLRCGMITEFYPHKHTIKNHRLVNRKNNSN